MFLKNGFFVFLELNTFKSSILELDNKKSPIDSYQSKM
ncbi:hypothetical protein X844_1296 [Listeria monocytogenes Lm_1823]|jgi:hypothetical protein|nr:hypothetical protein X844_1296 [Listeria monocytogenes Lm_1823]KSZ43436.1 hypothetical protein AOB47_487c [Listeria monocytogenes]KSZ48595.1 hypothetical protein AOA13_256c [Listeria monocytogenes]